jgi:predicted DNA-binding transcriptional regulator YafY
MNATSDTAAVEAALREAGRLRRRVRVTGRYRGADGDQHYEREWEPYAIEGDKAYVYSYFRDEFRRVPLDEIVKVEISDREFTPRRPIDL